MRYTFEYILCNSIDMDRRLQAFELLNQELAKEGLHLTLLCVGGVMF